MNSAQSLKISKQKNAAGLDSIPPEVWKTEVFNDIILKLCNAVYNGERIDKWSEGCIFPLGPSIKYVRSKTQGFDHPLPHVRTCTLLT